MDGQLESLLEGTQMYRIVSITQLCLSSVFDVISDIEIIRGGNLPIFIIAMFPMTSQALSRVLTWLAKSEQKQVDC